jgi:hypothetical protein
MSPYGNKNLFETTKGKNNKKIINVKKGHKHTGSGKLLSIHDDTGMVGHKVTMILLRITYFQTGSHYNIKNTFFWCHTLQNRQQGRIAVGPV